MNKKSKRVIAAFRLEGEPGRRKLDGFLRYIGERQLDWQLQLVRSRESFTAAHVASLATRDIDGIAFSLPTARDGAAALAKLEIPTVAIEIYDKEMLCGRTKNIVQIVGDAEGVGRTAAQHLMSQGRFRSYGYVADLQGSAWGKLRGEGFFAELASNGLSAHRYTTRNRGFDLPGLAKWIAALPKPAGVFVAFDDRATQVIEACREARASVPDDVAVLGVDNDETLCTHTTPTLSSVQPDHGQIGYLAAERLAALMDGRRTKASERIVVGVKEIVVRESTCAVSNAGRLVQRALAFIRTHAAAAIKPHDVATYLKVSRRLADLRFRQLQGESIGDAIRRYRLEEVRRRLVTTKDTIESIAAACHFTKLGRLKEAFAAECGCSMEACRTAPKQ